MTDTIKIKAIVDEDFQNYKKSSMFIGTCICDWKCPKEQGLELDICQNSSLAKEKSFEVSIESLFNRYKKNPITSAIVIGGLEPFLQFEEICSFVKYFRDNQISDDIVIYTGYYEYELEDELKIISNFENIIIKFGRFMVNSTPIYDEVLGVTLASENQYAKKI